MRASPSSQSSDDPEVGGWDTSEDRNRLVFRVDAGDKIGTGHFMRCLALAQAWKDSGGHVVFATSCQSRPLLDTLDEEDFSVIRLRHGLSLDWLRDQTLLHHEQKSWLVLDGYDFTYEYQLSIRDAGYRLLVIDDMGHLSRYCADLILNQNLHAKDIAYSCERDCQLLLGTKYVLLRREFLAWCGHLHAIPDVARKILIMMGGSDRENITLKVLRALSQVEIDGLEVVAVIGPINTHRASLMALIRDSRFPVHLIQRSHTLSELMDWADIAISGGGTTMWELAFMGVPSLGISRGVQETRLLRGTMQSGITVNLGPCEAIDEHHIAGSVASLAESREQRRLMSERGPSVVDGLGTQRVIESIMGSS